ncbi:MAG: TIM barrel protein [Pirellulaceae bacterium]
MHRRIFLQAAAASALPFAFAKPVLSWQVQTKMKFGLVTYLWGQDWDLPTLIGNCEQANILGVELRTEHKHGVEPDISAAQRQEVKQRFADSPVTCVGLGSNEQFHDVEPEKLKASIERSKAFLQLSHDIGASGVKVKPNNLPKDVPFEQTVQQIGKSLNEIAKFGQDLGQQVRLEVHGQCAELPTIKAIMDVADHPNATVCWNSNAEDLKGAGLEHNFRLVQDRFGDTAHVRELNIGDYTYQQLMKLFVDIDYAGWILLEARTKPDDRIAALVEQHAVWQQMVAAAQA